MSYIRLQAAIRRLTDADLRGLDNWLHQVIAERTEELEEQKRPGREVITRVVKPGGTMQLELVRCGKPACRSCPHGPYWYRYWKESGRTKSKYVGKCSREEKVRFAETIAKARTRGSPVVVSR
jgi:hypothetical protein